MAVTIGGRVLLYDVLNVLCHPIGSQGLGVEQLRPSSWHTFRVQKNEEFVTCQTVMV
jgi:hypothetical protein